MAPSARRARQRLCSGRPWALSVAARRLALAVRGLGVVSGRPRGARGAASMVFINHRASAAKRRVALCARARRRRCPEAPQNVWGSRCAAATERSQGRPSGRARADGPSPLRTLHHALAPGSPARRYGRLSAHLRLGAMLNGACPPAGDDRGGGGGQKLGGCCGEATPRALPGPGSRLLRARRACSPDRLARPLAR